MKKLLILFLILPIIFLTYSCDETPTEPEDNDTCDTCTTAYKPNIYIYPTETINLKVQIDFPNGGKILESIPHYNNYWNISVTPEGKIDNTYENAILKDNSSICEQFDNLKSIEHCKDNYYFAKRFNENDLSYCDKIISEVIKNECLN